MVFCHKCKNGIIDHEYEFTSHGQPVIIEALLCGNMILKDLYYNKNSKTKSDRVDGSKQAPILVGHAYGYCKGKFYNESPRSILQKEEEVDPDY